MASDASHKSVPEWARDKARNLLIESSPIKSTVTYTPSLWIVDVVAALIAEHEEAPVDPLLIEAREIASDTCISVGNPTGSGLCRQGEWDNEPLVKTALVALRRGIEIGGAK